METNPPPRPNAPRRRVTINPTVTTVDTLSIYDYTPSEIAAAWFDHEEMDKITQRCFKVLQKMEYAAAAAAAGGGGGRIHQKASKKYFGRGLEGHSRLGSISKTKNRRAAMDAVLDEQARQWKNETTTPQEGQWNRVQAISDAYRNNTSSSQLWAQVIGNRDRQAAESYLFEEEDDEDGEDVT